MRLLPIFSLLLLLAAPSLTLTIPPLFSRTCPTKYPTYQGNINKGLPEQASYNTDFFVNWKETNGTVLETLIQFRVPAGSWGCQLELFFPKGHPNLWGMNDGDWRLYVYRVNDEIKPGAAWNNAPKSAYQFGNSNGPLPINRVVESDIRRIINSEECQPTMGFRVAIAPEAVRGGVQFLKDATWRNVRFRMTHNY
ncbi:hypothetical protein BDV96DRAFT_643845 [Lophiotrema nucula]|uniref:Ubiquitin 3 binding protein But2 C-terminal domain-containing protein n=1 Tax=Lophiotrema nucula TaxID=690887 RepID=A0A6A5ZHC5_9PLEO|nr:hypothetical protein BDV96DRAFT_643845 [Lophiotrema nucula]